MAANNYFGYTAAGGTSFGTSAATSYPTSQTPGYAVQHTAQPYAAATPRASQASYDTYQTAQAAAAAAYQYASRQQTTYDKSQSYYPQATQVYSTTDTTHYQPGTGTSKATYSANATGYGGARAAKAATTQGAATSYVYSTNSTGGGTYSSYNSPGTAYPASMYVQGSVGSSQQAAAAAAAIGATTAAGVAQSVSAAASSAIKGQNNTWAGFKKGGFMKNQKAKQPPKPQQLHYCDVCKISCAGPQTYREHLEGQKHKKKEAAAKAGSIPPSSRGGTSLRCELCDVTCTGSDAYAAHIRGTKHQKVVKLHTKLGKPIPSTEPVVLATSNSASKAKPTAKPGMSGDKKILGTPKINFVGGTKLNTTQQETSVSTITLTADDEKAMEDDKNEIYDDKADIQPVGQDYIEEIRNDDGKVISFQCKLCECRFNDPNAKEMHMKGRRHRLQYKKKVNPDLVVDIKPSLRQRKIQEDRMRRQQMRDELWKRREEERWRDEMRFYFDDPQRMMEEEERLYWEERRRYEEEMEYYEMFRRYGRDPHMLPPPMMPPRGFMGPQRGPGPNMGPPMPPRRPDSVDDRHIMAKHTAVYPKEEELGAVQKIVTNTEKALKQVSDFLAEADAPLDAPKEVEKEPEVKKETPEGESEGENKEEKEEAGQMPNRTLKGVMRVGVLAKGLLLTGDSNVQLVVMCAEKPTRTLLDRVADNLPKQFSTVCPDENYEVKRCVEEAAIKVVATVDPKVSITVMLTSPVMRDGPEKEGAEAAGELVKDPPDVLDRQKCLDALAALRHAKWFQARASVLQSCVMIIRIMRDLCQRVPTWGRMSTWAMELLVEKVIFSSGQYMSPGDALRRVFEAIAGGILLPGGPGILDPCEKEPTDASSALTNQDREDITSSAQYALRLIAFRQIHKVLGMDPLPPPKFNRGPFPRKRRHNNSSGEGNDSEGADGKKDKKEGSEAEAISEPVVVEKK